VEFLEKLCEFQEHSDIPTSAVLPALYEIFQGNALAWYRNNRELWNCWDDFIGDFKQFYLPANYESFLEEQIFQRRQKVGESGRDYLVSLQTLLRRHGGFSSDRALQRLYGNLLPEYRQYIRRSEIQSPRDLIRQVEEYEALQREIAANRPAKPTAPSPPNFVRNQTPVAVLPPVTSPPERTQTTPTVRSDPPRTTRPEETPIETTPIRPQTVRHVRTPEERPSTSAANVPSDRNAICWRCGKSGHFRSQCRAPPRLFCSRCGQSGIMTRDCSCSQSEN
jgi:Zinc knuckle./Retrotransposon gag protein.